MNATKILSTLTIFTAMSFAELTPEQRVSDFIELGNLFARHYTPVQWKNELLGVDALNLRPWLEQVRAAKDDIEYLDVCVRYVGSLQDGHANFLLQSSFTATLGFNADLYEGKVLVDTLRANLRGIAIGDEVVSMDDRPIAEWLERMKPYASAGSVDSTRRIAANLLFNRTQQTIPWAHRVGDSAKIEIRKADGATATINVPWIKSGTPITELGRAGGLRSAISRSTAVKMWQEDPLNPWGAYPGERTGFPEDALTEKQKAVRSGVEFRMSPAMEMITSTGRFTPVFDPPPGFRPRLGGRPTDEFLSGTFPVGSATVGFLRIPNFTPRSATNAVLQFWAEIDALELTTSALVIDITNNGGGNGCLAELYMQSLARRPFWGVNSWYKPSQRWVRSFESNSAFYRASGEPWEIRLAEHYEGLMREAYQKGEFTGVFPTCSASLDVPPDLDFAYTKPVILLTNEMSFSAADLMAAMFADAGRGPIFGRHTAGLGGGTINFNGPGLSEAIVRSTVQILVHRDAVSVPGYPATRFYENIGIRPTIEVELNTRENLMNGGRPYLNRLLEEIRRLLP
ncbi:MAG: PDZ domain-containing protein [Bryobacteraceae bacterium]|nr:PDZ domain-containing protein [Bryobacteraceae bacterium]